MRFRHLFFFYSLSLKCSRKMFYNEWMPKRVDNVQKKIGNPWKHFEKIEKSLTTQMLLA